MITDLAQNGTRADACAEQERGSELQRDGLQAKRVVFGVVNDQQLAGAGGTVTRPGSRLVAPN
eukprot:CAMPEP_0179911332 /NCGR_PEP_ID=MMETSP0982-20121206/46306_1 /TAXON_ID=483367 /ORGANISM="non described non described, Strain CCMP 2436" /LENGTH=62 /DNA_ID=CAMNT_0021813069 /DNA_START=507 /DNA_END=695 /DNA_ORIENTATION=-